MSHFLMVMLVSTLGGLGIGHICSHLGVPLWIAVILGGMFGFFIGGNL